MEQGVLDTLYQVLRSPSEGIRDACRREAVGWAVLIVAIVSAVFGATQLLGSSGALSASDVLDIFWGVVVWVVGLFVIAGIMHVIALVLGGEGSYSGLVSGLGFASFPIVLFAPLSLFYALSLGALGLIVYFLGGIGLFLWVFVGLSVAAIRENYGFSTRRAIVTYWMPGILLMGFSFIFLALHFMFLL